MNRTSAFLLLLLPLLSQAQPDRAYYEDGKTVKIKGKITKIKVKQTYGEPYIQEYPVGKWLYYYPDGVLAKEEDYGNGSGMAGLLNGVAKYYDSTGTLLQECLYKGGTRSGPCKIISPGHFLFENEEFTIDENGLSHSKEDSLMDAWAANRMKASGANYKLVVGNKAAAEAKDWQKEYLAKNIQGIDPRSEENLVRNPTIDLFDLEETDPRKKVQFPYWASALFTPDFTTMGKNEGRVGIRVSTVQDNRVEAAYNQLLRPLQDSQWYCFQMKARLGKETSTIATNGMAVFFQPSPGRYDFMYYQSIQPNLVLPEGLVLSETNEYILLSAPYRAKGGERAVVIGGFRPLEKTLVLSTSSNGYVMPDAEAYYYVDDVVLSPIGDSIDCPCNMSYPEWTKPVPFEEGQSIVLNNIQFETAKDILLPQSFVILDSLVNWMRVYPSMEIEVRGHTDDQGDFDYNMDLSKRRAAAVVEYLKLKNIEESRMKSDGFGETQPLVPNESAENRQKNRRVEFVILKI